MSAGSLDSIVGQLAGDFTDRLARGESPSIDEYTSRYPEHAASIRQILSALHLLHPGSSARLETTATLPAQLTPQQIGDFRLGREIGRGGMGVVYEAVQLSLGRRVALKVLPFAAMLDARQLQRFHNEARAAAQLHHEHIVPVFFVGEERGVHYYAMQLVEEFPSYEQRHTALTTWVVGPPMLIEGATAMLLIWFRPPSVPAWCLWTGMALLGVIWLSTAFVQVPCHEVLSPGFDLFVHQRLVWTNWLRTFAWSLRGILVLWIAWSSLR